MVRKRGIGLQDVQLNVCLIVNGLVEQEGMAASELRYLDY